jgi:hypothetical protein
MQKLVPMIILREMKIYSLQIYCKVIFVIHTIYCNFDVKNYFNGPLSSYLPKDP